MNEGVSSVAVISACLALAKKPANVDPKSGNLILEYVRPLYYLGLVGGVVLPFFTLVMMFLHPFKGPGDAVAGVGVLTFFLMGGGYLLLEYFKTQIILRHDGIESHSPWRSHRFFT